MDPHTSDTVRFAHLNSRNNVRALIKGEWHNVAITAAYEVVSHNGRSLLRVGYSFCSPDDLQPRVGEAPGTTHTESRIVYGPEASDTRAIQSLLNDRGLALGDLTTVERNGRTVVSFTDTRTVADKPAVFPGYSKKIGREIALRRLTSTPIEIPISGDSVPADVALGYVEYAVDNAIEIPGRPHNWDELSFWS